MNCYCGKDKPYKSCCGKIHKNIHKAKTSEDLMRSRYSAFVIGDGDYLMESHHSSTRPIQDKEAIVDWANSVRWLKLEMVEVLEDVVEFKAHYYESGDQFIHERSKFVKENGHWVYLGME